MRGVAESGGQMARHICKPLFCSGILRPCLLRQLCKRHLRQLRHAALRGIKLQTAVAAAVAARPIRYSCRMSEFKHTGPVKNAPVQHDRHTDTVINPKQNRIVCIGISGAGIQNAVRVVFQKHRKPQCVLQ